MSAIGTHPVGVEPLAGDILPDPPTVVLLGPAGLVDTGGPNLLVQWNYEQAQNRAQEWFRVLATNVAGEVVHYDSGWRNGDSEEWPVDVDSEEVPHDTDDLSVTVLVRGPEAIGTGELARYQTSDVETVELRWGEPIATITEPENQSVVTSPTDLQVEWDFADEDGKTQSAFRVRLLLFGSGAIEWDSGWVTSTDETYTVPAVLRDGSTYNIELQLKNNHGIRSGVAE